MRLVLLLVPALASGALTACDRESVHVGFRPQAGAVYRYEIKVQSVVTTLLGGQAPERTVEEITLESHDTVLAAGPEEIRVEVRLRRAGSPERTFHVRFDRAAQLAGVDAVDGLPPDVLGPSGLPAFLPAAVTAPPDRALSPGETWPIDASPTLPDGDVARLQGTGRLVRVTEAGGRRVAAIRAETRLPLSSTSEHGGSTITLRGTETTESTAMRGLEDGAVQEATSVRKGDYDLEMSAPTGSGGMPMTGNMSVEIRSETRRLPDEAPQR